LKPDTVAKGTFENGISLNNINHSSGLSSKHMTSLSKIDCLTNDNSLKAEPSRDAPRNLDGKINSVPGFQQGITNKVDHRNKVLMERTANIFSSD
jgi:hypothetical protein